MTTEPLYEAEVLDHRALSHGGRVYLAGDRVRLTFDELADLEGGTVMPLDEAYITRHQETYARPTRPARRARRTTR